MAATPATRMMLLKIGMSSPLQLLRAPLFGASTNINIQTQFISDPTRLQPQGPIFPQHFLADQADIGVGAGSSAIDASNTIPFLGRRFGGFEEMACVEARGKSLDDDKDEDYSDGEFDSEDVEDFDENFDDDGDEDEDESDFDDDDVIDARK